MTYFVFFRHSGFEQTSPVNNGGRFSPESAGVTIDKENTSENI